jgi:diguanylate cyclase (GGDEF)-like protein/PAS domain S-box-containing protein
MLLAFAALCVLAIVLGCANAVFYRRQVRAIEAKRHGDSRYRAVVEQAGDGILLVDAQTGRLAEANPSLRRRLGYTEEEIVTLKLEDILVETLVNPHTMPLEGITTHTRSRPRTLKQRCKSGQLLDVEVTVSHLEISGRHMLCYIAHDVTERNNIELKLLRNQRRLDYLAHHDALTGLPNRRLLRIHLERALQACSADAGVAVLLLDLDNFKLINDSYGHNVGDELLVEVAQQLKKLVDSRGLVARLGGDEFVVVLRDARRQVAASTADMMLRVLAEPLRVAGRAISTSVSIGVTLCPEDSGDVEFVLRNADLAMYKAKEAGRSQVLFFQDDMKRRVRRRLTMERALRAALEKQQFVLHYQPQIGIATRRIVALEALVRWEHPQLGIVPPSKFIPIAEESGLIVPIGEHILRTACKQVVRWQAEGVPAVPVAVNWSAVQLQRQSVLEVVPRILEETGMSPNLLALEITEGALVRNIQQHAAALQALRDSGVRIQIDDFGTGYSSLNYLRKLPVDTLKIDRRFIDHVVENPEDQAIVAAILLMAKSLGLRVVAEGVETAAQLDLLDRLGCEVAQAFFFSRPLPADQCRTLLEELATRPSFTDTLRIRVRRNLPANVSPARSAPEDTQLRELHLSLDREDDSRVLR